jgi:hypothetical protein
VSVSGKPHVAPLTVRSLGPPPSRPRQGTERIDADEVITASVAFHHRGDGHDAQDDEHACNPRSMSATSTAPKIILVANTSGTRYERMVLARDEGLDFRELLSLRNAGRPLSLLHQDLAALRRAGSETLPTVRYRG